MEPLLTKAAGYGLSPVRESREVWVCLTGSIMPCWSQRIDKAIGFAIKAPWPWPFEDQGSKPRSSFDHPLPVILSARGQACPVLLRGYSWSPASRALLQQAWLSAHFPFSLIYKRNPILFSVWHRWPSTLKSSSIFCSRPSSSTLATAWNGWWFTVA